jgi:preprotein translocase subunit SecA
VNAGGALSGKTLRPGGKLGIYPQRLDPVGGRFQRWAEVWSLRLLKPLRGGRYRLQRLSDAVDKEADKLAGEGVDLAVQADKLRYELHREGFVDDLAYRAFALIRSAAERELGTRHYPTQLLGGWIILNGNMAEMDTGEGRSLTATLPAATAALAGAPVHVVTTNEYLARRDAEAFRPLYEALGLTVSTILEDMGSEARRKAYGADIVYLTNQQLAFDYLRDRMTSGNVTGRLELRYGEPGVAKELMLRGLCFAILDEADSVLIDEARTPLILSRDHADAMRERIYGQALSVAGELQEDSDFEQRGSEVRLTEQGRRTIGELTSEFGGLFSGARHREFLVRQSLVALHILRRDHHYLVRNNKVEIIDQNTGRVMADRSWQQGLHQMVECKEGCPVTGQRETLASISYQRFFRRYLHLGGMSGTLRQVRSELRSVYGLNVYRVPNHRPPLRRLLGTRIYPRSRDKWLAVLSSVEEFCSRQRPILVGTRSLYDSDLVGRLFARRSLQHRALNARQDQSEAEVVAGAGRAGQITVATNMAGRGTDIALGENVASLGGLHVIGVEANEEFRVDRQLYGRCARQGDPGSCEAILSLEDSLFRDFYPRWLTAWLESRLAPDRPLRGRLANLLVAWAQRANRRRYREQRQDLLLLDEEVGKTLAYSGTGD